MHYVGLKVERAELEGSTLPLTQNIQAPQPKTATKGSGKSYPKTTPKAKAKMASAPVAANIPQEEWVTDPEDFMLVQQELEAEYPDVQHLESRMLHMENALSQVIAHLEKITVRMDATPAVEDK